MPRPPKCRRVCAAPRRVEFVPAGPPCQEQPVILQLDEYEVIRLIDLEGMTQEECARQMDVARTTVTGIYDRARRKIALAIVEGRRLVSRGGNIQICSGEGRGCGKACCRHRTKKGMVSHENCGNL